MRTVASVMVLIGWAVVLVGLYVIPVSPDPELDLEAGGSFAAGFAIYLPATALTVLLLGLLPTAVWAKWVGPLAVVMAACLVCPFGFWILAQDYLLDYRPGLEALVWFHIGLSGAALILGATAAALTREASRAAPLEVEVSPSAR